MVKCITCVSKGNYKSEIDVLHGREDCPYINVFKRLEKEKDVETICSIIRSNFNYCYDIADEPIHNNLEKSPFSIDSLIIIIDTIREHYSTFLFPYFQYFLFMRFLRMLTKPEEEYPVTRQILNHYNPLIDYKLYLKFMLRICNPSPRETVERFVNSWKELLAAFPIPLTLQEEYVRAGKLAVEQKSRKPFLEFINIKDVGENEVIDLFLVEKGIEK